MEKLLLICLLAGSNSLNPFDHSGLLCISSVYPVSKGAAAEPFLKLTGHTFLSSVLLLSHI